MTRYINGSDPSRLDQEHEFGKDINCISPLGKNDHVTRIGNDGRRGRGSRRKLKENWRNIERANFSELKNVSVM